MIGSAMFQYLRIRIPLGLITALYMLAATIAFCMLAFCQVRSLQRRAFLCGA